MATKTVFIVACVVIVVLITAAITAKFIVPRIKRKRAVEESIIGVVLIWIIIPTMVGVLTTYISMYLFPETKSEWESNITTIDEEILKDSGCNDLDNYYVRVFESDKDLSTGNVSTYLKRIETSNKIKSEECKHRYIEIINKVGNTSPKIIIYQNNSDGNKEALCLENTHGKYLEEISKWTNVFFD